jgi:hypothetical protein
MSDKTIESIICDGCGKELITKSSYPSVYALVLGYTNVNRNTTGFEYAVMVYPPIDGTKHFCDTKCLSEWIKT